MTKVFTDNAVLQRDMPVRVWGTADAGREVTVTFGGQTKESVADQDGVWSVMLDAMPACNEGKNLRWSEKCLDLPERCCRRSLGLRRSVNMEMPLNSWGQERLAYTEDEISGDYSFVRFNRTDHIILDQPRNGGIYRLAPLQRRRSEKHAAVGFHLLFAFIKNSVCPIGLIDSNWGGSSINSWIPESGWKKVPELVPIREKYEADLAAGKKIEDRAKQAGMFNAMLQPWVPYAIRGAIWYQGESNAGEREFCFFKQKAMIRSMAGSLGKGLPVLLGSTGFLYPGLNRSCHDR